MMSAPLRPKSNDLWALAAAELSDDSRRNINFSCPDKLNILSELQKLNEKSREECISKRWRFTRKSGETIVFRDLFAKVVKWIDLFKQVGDCAIQYDPVHAALPWAGVRFLLQIAVNDVAKFNFAVESAASIAEMICRYAIFEDVYIRHTSSATDELKIALVQLYAAIMIYFSKVKSYFDQNSAKRIIKSGLLSDSDLDRQFGLISAEQVVVDRYAILVDAQYQIDRHTKLKRLLKEIDGPLNRMSDGLKNVQDHLEASKRTQILRWISPEPYIKHHEQTKKDVLSGTGKWLLSDSTFKKWKKESVSSILWLHGILGSGKSKLVSIVIEDAMKDFDTGCSPPPAFFYCSRNPAEPARSSPEAILASIVRQLSSLEPGLPLLDPVVTSYKKREAQAFASGALRIDESCALIIQLVEHYPLTTIVVDALDECDPEKRADLLDSLETILRDSSNLVKIFVSSRDDWDIVCHLQDYPNLEIASDRNRDDIVTFVRTEVKELVRKRKLLRHTSSQAKEELTKLIIDKVTEGAAGMFRWASMQLQYLCSMKLDNDIRERLGRLTPDLESLYSEIYENLWTDHGEARHCVTRNVLSWLLCAQQALKSKEFLAAVSVTPKKCLEQVSKDQILDICCNLVVFDAPLDTFRFAHLSVREFLEKRPEYASIAVNSLAAEICLLGLISAAQSPAVERFLDKQPFSLRNRLLLPDKLRRYLYIYWATHCKLAGDQRTKGVLKDLFRFFLCEELGPASAFAVWNSQSRHLFQDHDISSEIRRKLYDAISSSANPLAVACAFDFPEVVQNYVARQTFQADFRNSNNRTALHVAIVHNSCEVMLILLAEKSVQVTEEMVEAAAEKVDSGKEVMMLLLEQRGDEIKITEEIVKAAAENPGGKEIMKLLLEQCGDEIKITEKIVETVAENDDSGVEIMILLLEQRGEEIKITEKIVKAAAENNSGKEIMMLLLEQRNEEIKMTEKIVKAAARSYRKEVMMLLLEQRGEEIKMTEEIVKAAAGSYRKEVMMLLLEQRVEEIKITEEIVKAAAANPYCGKEIMMLLLNNWLLRNVDEKQLTDSLSSDHVAVLHAASLAGHKAVIEQLIMSGADVNIDIGEDGTALHIAAHEGHEPVVQMLLSKGAGLNSKDSHGWTPYISALMSGKDSICRILSDYGCEKSTGLIPDGLNKAVISSEVTITEDGSTAMTEFVQALAQTYDPFCHCHQVRANHPIPTTNQTFYFEVTVLNEGVQSFVAVGICYNRSERRGMPGWSRGSWAYHGDDGKTYAEVGTGSAYGPVYGTGDVVGCGTDMQTGNVFFTKNGENLGTAFTVVKGKLFPVIGIVDKDVRVRVNFGQSDFVYKGI